ncbi:hypothetical protein [Paracoccus salsus]|uniref:hypothetical protein n=1 Tax=Paracoccus salsus TaxID=2911061 RepID=UPI001F3FCDAF|nr:hypothetical protein [Paracoccus salsus]MCF3974042.1 hypothetical protein [Paracoccus salsus]
MPRLFMLLLSISIATLAGMGVIVVLVLGHVGMWPILTGAGIGAIAAFPVSWLVARRITNRES